MHKTVQHKKYTATWYSHAVRNAVKIFFLNHKNEVLLLKKKKKEAVIKYTTLIFDKKMRVSKTFAQYCTQTGLGFITRRHYQEGIKTMPA